MIPIVIRSPAVIKPAVIKLARNGFAEGIIVNGEGSGCRAYSFAGDLGFTRSLTGDLANSLPYSDRSGGTTRHRHIYGALTRRWRLIFRIKRLRRKGSSGRHSSCRLGGHSGPNSRPNR